MPEAIQPLSRNELKHVRSLALKKVRDAEGVFVAEGPRLVGDLLHRLPCTLLAVTDEALSAFPQAQLAETVRLMTRVQSEQASSLRSPQGIVGVFRLPATTAVEARQWPIEGIVLALDGVQDPGNAGTILRTAAWMGVRGVVLGPDCADLFAPKAVQASMGAVGLLPIYVADLPTYLQSLPEGTLVLGTALDGDDLYSTQLPERGVVVMGSEGRGLSLDVTRLLTHRVRIPTYPANNPAAPESLNVAAATAIVLGELRRQIRGL